MSKAARRSVAVLLVSAATTGLAAHAAAQTDDDAAQRAAEEIIAARERANAAAADYLEAQSELDQLDVERQRLVGEVAELEDEVEVLRKAVEKVAVDRFTASGSDGIPILTDMRRPTEQVQADVLATVVAESGSTTIDDYEEAKRRLHDKRAELDETERQLEALQVELLELQAEAEAEVERLRAVEAERLENEAVAAAVVAKQREEARQLAEFQRRQAEAVRAAAPNLAVPVPAAISAAAEQAETSGRIGASGGAAGGRTGGGGSGTNPRAAGEGYIDFIICPVLGPSGYGDTWGAPRSGGRRHQGVDMLAPTGTPLVAVVSGTVEQGSNRLGGIALRLYGDNGTRYYYAHLSAYEGVNGRVEQGQVIGYIGDTGNATGVPHLHFEIHPGGGVPVNPYLSVLQAGC